MAELRKMTMGEIAEIADIPKETARGRLKNYLGGTGSTYGWARFDVPSTMQVAVHAEMMRQTGVGEIAVKTASFVADSIFNFCKYPPHVVRRTGQLEGNFLIFRQSSLGGADAPKMWRELWCDSQKDALFKLGEHIADSSEHVNAAGFYFLNVSTVADWALDRIFDLQGIAGNEAKVPL